MAQLRSDILCKRKCEDIEISERQYKRLHIAEPIQECQSDDDDEFTFNAFNDSDAEEEESPIIDECNINNTFGETDIGNNNLNPEQWTRMVENWIEMVDTENPLDSEDVINEEETYDFEVGGHDTHPADNSLAKWKLLDLFSESLEAPIYVIQ